MSEKIHHPRRRFLGIAAMTAAATQLGRFGSAIGPTKPNKTSHSR